MQIDSLSIPRDYMVLYKQNIINENADAAGYIWAHI
jgi:hypothetical protein